MTDTFLNYSGMFLIILGILNVLLMLEVLGKKGTSESYREIHRWIGRIFIIGFLAFFVYMLPRMRFLTNFPTYILLHAFVGLAILPLVIGKYLIVTRYRNYMSSAAQVGVIIMIGSLLIVISAAGPGLISRLYGG